MKGNKHGRLNKARSNRVFKLSPTTRAIRVALAGSATLLAFALAGSSVAYAGTCVTTATNTVSCDGVFTETVPGSLLVPVADMTLILGDNAPTSVVPVVGTVGIEATWSGSIDVVSHADIATSGADGVHAYGSSATAGAAFSNDGSVTTSVTVAGANAVDVNAYGDVAVTNAGDLSAHGADGFDVTTVTAYSVDGVTTIDNLDGGTISAIATDGNALAVNAFGFYGTVVNNAGSILGSSVNGTATGVFVEAFADAIGGGIAEVSNDGTIDVSSTNSQAIGILAYAGSTSAVVESAGAITATGSDLAVGISTYATGATGIDSSGTIDVIAVAGNAASISASSDWGNISIINSGDLSAAASNDAAGIVSAGYNGSIDNEGSLVVSAGSGMASGIVAADYYSSTVNNGGGIQVTSQSGDAVGVDASTALLVAVDNTGTISVDGANDAIGIIASSTFGTDVDNTGAITVDAQFGNATGVIAEVLGGTYRYEDAIVHNIGSIAASSDAGDAIGIALAADFAFGVVYNAGSVSAVSLQGAATGISVTTEESVSSSYVLNDGVVDAVASGQHGVAHGISVYANDADSFVITSGSISANAGLSGIAEGVFALSQNGSTTVRNSGDINVSTIPADVAVFIVDLDYATGIYAGSEDGSTVANTGSITVDGGWQALGIEARADDGIVSVTNSATGVITVTGSRTASGISTWIDNADAFGRDTVTDGAVIDNAGTISVRTTNSITDPNGSAFGGTASGINAVLAIGGDVTITNSGSISVQGAQFTVGIRSDTLGDVAVGNSGSIGIVGSGFDSSYGIQAISIDDNVAVSNSGEIAIVSSLITNGDIATGVSAHAISRDGSGDASVINTGLVSINGAATGYGINVEAGLMGTGNVGVNNVGDIRLSTSAAAWGIDTMLWKYDGDTSIDNSGTIAVSGSDARGMRIGQLAAVGDINITNSGDIDAVVDSTQAVYTEGGIGIFARRYSFDDGGVVDIENSGSIRVVADMGDSTPGFRGAHAHGMQVSTYSNDINIDNSGSILAELNSSGPNGATALGIFVKNGYGTSFGDIGVSNVGAIETSVVANDAVSPFTFLYYTGAYTAGIHARATYGDVDVANAGSISAGVHSDYNADAGITRASGISVVSQVGRGVERDFELGDLVVANAATGDIRAYSQADLGESTTIAMGISALVSVGTYGSLLVSAGHGIDIDNAGLVSAIATTGEGATGSATATGISAINGSAQGFATVGNAGRLNAEATTTGTASAIGLFASASGITIELDASSVVTAAAAGADGIAAALSLRGGSIAASNAGILQAEFIGAGGNTYGALIASTTGAVTFSNSGTINATDADLAMGVQLDSLTTTTLVNSGTINAFSETGSGIAVRTGDSVDLIQNSGTLNGALLTAAGNDVLDNGLGATWHATGSTDFGAGDDSVINAGTILLDNASITLGDSVSFNNAFTSNGVIRVSGDSSIDLGAQNATAFTSSGIIDFRDSAADDVLTINGDFDGSGAINLDVSGLNNSSDVLYINGDVTTGSNSTINVALMALPTTQDASVPLVYVSGDSTAESFQLGEVRYDPDQNFLTLNYDVDLLAEIDTSNATPDIFSLGMSVSGLSDSGTLAATIAPGVQSLLGSQVGTWRQRAGVIDKFRKGGVALWARLFQDSGVVSPQHAANNFGQDGNFAFDQRNSGTEVGADFAVSDQLSVGLLVAKSDARQRLQGTGLGATTIDGDSYGAYATWLSPSGFYIDASFRRMDFDAKLNTSAGQIRTSGDADGLSLEGGYAWTLGNGLKIEPQLQYTRIQVDDIDALSGQLASFQSEGGDSSRSRVGVMFRKAFAGSSVVWTPYASVNAVREFDGKNRFSINGDFSGHTSAEGTHALVEAGLNADVGRLSVFGGANWQDGGALESVVSGQVGVRFAW